VWLVSISLILFLLLRILTLHKVKEE